MTKAGKTLAVDLLELLAPRYQRPELLSIQLVITFRRDWRPFFGSKNVAPVVPYPGPPLHAAAKLGRLQ